jgi:hypothetical protein
MQSKSPRRVFQATSPTLELGARGPRGEAGFLLRGALPEAVTWDIENEVVSNRRLQLGKDRWWVASSYFDTILDIVLRFFPSVLVRYPDTGEERVVHAEDPPASKHG